MSKKIRMNLDNWTYVEYLTFLFALQRGEMSKVYDLAQNIIVSWDYDVPLETPEAILELGVEESARVINTITESVNAYMESLEDDIKEVTVDFNGVKGAPRWNTRKFLEFNNAMTERKWDKVEAMLKEVAFLPDMQVGEPLSATEGARLSFAVRKAYERILSGKN